MRSPAAHPRTAGLGALLAILLLLVSAGTAHAHIRLERTTPARDAVLTTMPPALHLEFSGRIEERYTSITFTAPDGTPIVTGRIVFDDGSDRAFTVAIPPLVEPGTYTVSWRTAGADGHVLEGSYSFVLAPDSTAQSRFPTGDTAAAAAADQHAGHHDHGEPTAVVTGWDVLGRGLHFVALLLLSGAVALRMALLPRLGLDDAAATMLRRRAWQALAFGAVLLGVAAVLRLWLQSTALHGAERAWSAPLLSIMLRDTGWGRAWVVQIFLFALLGAAVAWARPQRDTFAARLALVATAGLCAIPALTGHAAGTGRAGWVITANDALHVAAAGAWLGTLALLVAIALPLLRRERGAATALDAVTAFSPLALTAAGVVALTGLLNAIAHLDSIDQLRSTEYGLTLLWKVGLVGVVLLAGFVNWRVVLPRARRSASIRMLRLTASLELLFAVLVVVATAALTGRPRP